MPITPPGSPRISTPPPPPNTPVSGALAATPDAPALNRASSAPVRTETQALLRRATSGSTAAAMPDAAEMSQTIDSSDPMVSVVQLRMLSGMGLDIASQVSQFATVSKMQEPASFGETFRALGREHIAEQQQPRAPLSLQDRQAQARVLTANSIMSKRMDVLNPQPRAEAFTLRVNDTEALTHVRQNECVISKGPLITHGLMPCIGVTVYDPATQTAALMHFDSDISIAQEHPPEVLGAERERISRITSAILEGMAEHTGRPVASFTFHMVGGQPHSSEFLADVIATTAAGHGVRIDLGQDGPHLFRNDDQAVLIDPKKSGSMIY
jgi:hypothetical protein